MATAASLAADAAEFGKRHAPGPPKKRSDESRRAYDRQFSRAYRASHPGRRHVLSAESRRRINARMKPYLREWRRRTGHVVSESVVRLTWARLPGEAVFHLVPTNRKFTARPPLPTHPICQPTARVTRLVRPFQNRTPVSQCRDCLAERARWERMLNATMPAPQTAPQTAQFRPPRSPIDAYPRLREALQGVSFPLDGLSPPSPG